MDKEHTLQSSYDIPSVNADKMEEVENSPLLPRTESGISLATGDPMLRSLVEKIETTQKQLEDMQKLLYQYIDERH